MVVLPSLHQLCRNRDMHVCALVSCETLLSGAHAPRNNIVRLRIPSVFKPSSQRLPRLPSLLSRPSDRAVRSLTVLLRVLMKTIILRVLERALPSPVWPVLGARRSPRALSRFYRTCTVRLYLLRAGAAPGRSCLLRESVSHSAYGLSVI